MEREKNQSYHMKIKSKFEGMSNRNTETMLIITFFSWEECWKSWYFGNCNSSLSDQEGGLPSATEASWHYLGSRDKNAELRLLFVKQTKTGGKPQLWKPRPLQVWSSIHISHVQADLCTHSLHTTGPLNNENIIKNLILDVNTVSWWSN